MIKFNKITRGRLEDIIEEINKFNAKNLNELKKSYGILKKKIIDLTYLEDHDK